MKLLFLLCLLSNQQAWAACATGSLSFYRFQGNATDTCGGNNGTVNTIPFNTSPAPPSSQYVPPDTKSAGPSAADGNSITLPTAVINTAAGTLEGYFNVATYVSGDLTNSMFAFDNAGDTALFEGAIVYTSNTVFHLMLFATDSTGTLQQITSAQNLNANQWYKFAWTWASGHTIVYINNAVDSNSAFTVGWTGNWTLGKCTLFEQTFGGAQRHYNGQEYGLRFSNFARTSFPTLDPAGAVPRFSLRLNKL